MTEEDNYLDYSEEEEEEDAAGSVKDEPIPREVGKIPLLLFINPMSGGGLGKKLIDKLEGTPSICIVKLPDNKDDWQTLYPDIMGNRDLRVCAAGGDGTVNWVICLLNQVFTGDFHPPLAIIPFGTGNDMSRSLKWGKGVKESTIKKIGKKLMKMTHSTKIENIDVWNLSIKIQDEEPKDSQMINYFSIGVDAAISLKYESLRQEKKPKSQIESLFLYIPAGSSTFGQETTLSDYTSIKVYGLDDSPVTEEVDVQPMPKERTLVFQSTKTMYGGKVDWHSDKPASMSDGKLEVRFNKGVTQLTMCQMGLAHGRSFGQAKGAKITTTDQCCFQVDGEARRIEKPCEFVITHKGNYPFIMPKYKKLV